MDYLVILLVFLVFLQTRIMDLKHAVYCLAAQSGAVALSCLVIGLASGEVIHGIVPAVLTLLVKVVHYCFQGFTLDGIHQIAV